VAARSHGGGERHEAEVAGAHDGRLRPALGLRRQDGDGKIDDAKQAKKQAEDVQDKLKKDLKKGQNNLGEDQ
jgi:hypothetical protein